MPHNENSRVKIPALVHFTRLGYKFISLRKYEGVIDDDTNILVDVLCDAINRINATSLTTTDVQKIVNALKAMLENDDLGREFYSVLINGYNGLKLIDFEDFGGTVNSYHVVTEMTCKNGSDEFRPDITPLINGIPLAFIEVKKPNNKGGIKAEYDRMLMRVKNKKFRRFINLTQIMVFSNNSEYDDTEAVPLEGAFYSTISYEKLFFSHFREEDEKLLTSVPEKDEAVENFILTDNNLSSIKYSPEYVTNSSPVSPTNRIITSKDDLLQNGDIVFVRSNGNKNLVGRTMFIHDIKDPVCYSGFCIAFRPNTDLVYPEYLFYVLRAPFCKKQYGYSQQTNITNLSQGVLGDVDVPVPDLDTQQKLAKILSEIDLKIISNTRICVELEAMAKTLYDYWFTQFDFPNAEGKPYCSSGGEMVWNDQLKRKIPKGWSAGQLSDIANITMGQSPSGDTYNENGSGTIFYQGCTDFGTRFPVPRVYTSAPTRFAKAGDILMSVRAPVGTLNIAMEDCCIGRGLAALNSKFGSQLHLLYTLSGFKQLFDVMDGNGTTFGSITKDTLFEMKVVIPRRDQIKSFEEMVQPIEQKIRVAEQENRELTKLRDWLLPVLMNGQATVE